MLLKIFIKPNFISFYKEDKFYLLNEQYKNDKLIFEEKKEFNTKKELINYINEISSSNPQTYVSTVILSQNQGVVPSCDKKEYKKLGIELENIKYICIKNRYSFYTTIYELMELTKSFEPDFLYPIFALIDIKAISKHNTLYILTTKSFNFILIYKDSIPVYSDIFEIEEKTTEFKEEEDDEIEDISDIDIIEDFDDILDEDIENIEEIDESSVEETKEEYRIIEDIKNTLKEYYEEGGDFIEKIVILDTLNTPQEIKTLIEDEIFITTTVQEFDILKTINQISRENV
ncbi:MAG: hypothetical protein ABGX26_00600 [Nautiliaceae bacterium]